MNNKAKSITILAVLLLIFLLFIRYIYIHVDEFAKLKLVNPIYLLFLIILTIFFSLTYGLVIKYLVEPFKIKLKFNAWFGLSVITSFYNIIAPATGGLVPRALYLKKKHNFHYSSFISSLSGIYITHFLVGSTLGLLSILFLYVKYKAFNLPIFLAFLIIFFVSLTITLFSPKLKKSNHRWFSKIVKVVNGWHKIRKNHKVFFIVCIITIVQTLLNMVGIALAFEIFNIKIRKSIIR